MFRVKLETIDHEDRDFVQYLAERGITAEPTGVVYGQPGGGEDVVYTADSEETLLNMIDQYWGGAEQVDFTIENS
jgi:hypothetical protein